MYKSDLNIAELRIAVQAALNGDWQGSHNIAQKYGDTTANWLHAALHKIEGDESNSRYWYARTSGRHYEEFIDTTEELRAILSQIT
jgi:hypothetical protein